jgi:hypothetical protein
MTTIFVLVLIALALAALSVRFGVDSRRHDRAQW